MHSDPGFKALRRLAAAVTPGSRVLEVGSGPGWDADRLEALGVDVHRTDAATAFCDFQAELGKRCNRLDLLSDPIDERYGGVLMLCVLQHFERAELDGALRMLALALDAGAQKKGVRDNFHGQLAGSEKRCQGQFPTHHRAFSFDFLDEGQHTRSFFVSACNLRMRCQ